MHFIRNVAFNGALAVQAAAGERGVLLHNTIVKNGDAFAIHDDVVFAAAVAERLFLGDRATTTALNGPGG